MRKKIENALIELGVPANFRGFAYICDAMEIYAEDESYVTSKKIVLYDKIAKKHDTTARGVERCIRYALSKAVTYGNLESLNKYMSAAQKPTNGNLLACLYFRTKEQ